MSIVVPCYNHGRFLAEAIESALAQTHQRVEVVVVDDGSTDDTAAVSARYSGVRYVRQANQGLAAARNTGIRESTGEYLLFLDADDRLLPKAIETNLAWLNEHPGCAFVFGEHRYIDLDGRLVREWTRQPPVTTDYYPHFLTANHVGMCATALFRQSVFATVGVFDGRWNPCEDYDLYLRIARRFPVCSHNMAVAEYRRYGSAMSDDVARMLKVSVSVLRSQRRFVRGQPPLESAYAKGLAYWRSNYGRPLASQIRQRWSDRAGRVSAAHDALTLLRYAPFELARLLAGRVRRGEPTAPWT